MKRKLLSVILAVLMLMTMMPMTLFALAATETFNATVGSVEYKFTVTKKDTVNSVYEVSVDGLVTPKSQESLELPAAVTNNEIVYTVTSVGKEAFSSDNKLKSVKFSDSIITIGVNAFRYSALEEVEIPDNVEKISTRAFANCKSLKKVTLGKNLETLGSSPFGNTPLFTELVINSYSIPYNLSEVSVSTSSVDYDVFATVQKVTLGADVSVIGKGAFANCTAIDTGEFTISADNANFSYADGVIYNKDKTKLVYVLPTATDFTIPETVTEIEYIADYKANLSGNTGTLEVTKFNERDDNKGLRVGEMLQAELKDYTGGGDIYFYYIKSAKKDESGKIPPKTIIASGEIRAYKTYDTSVPNSETEVSNSTGTTLWSPYPYFAWTHCSDYDEANNVIPVVTVKAYEVLNGKISLIDTKDFALGDKDTLKAISGNRVVMVEGEELTIGQILCRSGVTHVTCSYCYYANVGLADESTADTEVLTITPGISGDFDSGTKLTAVKASDKVFNLTFDFKSGRQTGTDKTTGNPKYDGCMYHGITMGESGAPEFVEGLTLDVIVTKEPTVEAVGYDGLKIAENFDGTNFAYRIGDNYADDKGVFTGLDDGTEYSIEVIDKVSQLLIFTVSGTTNAKPDHEATDFTLTAEGIKCGVTADDFNKAFKVDYATDRSTETPAPSEITVKIFDADGTEYSLVTPPAKHGTYTVKVSTSEDGNYAEAEDLEIGTFTIAYNTTEVSGSAPTCTDVGYSACLVCECGEYFEKPAAESTDAVGAAIADLSAWQAAGGKLDALNHDWDISVVKGTTNDAGWIWTFDEDGKPLTAIPNFVCKNDSSHTYTNCAATPDGTTNKIELTSSGTVSCTVDGFETYTATVTFADYSETPVTDTYTITFTHPGHTGGTPVQENVKPATCTADGSYDEVVYCTVKGCGAEVSREQKTLNSFGHDWGAPTWEWAEDGSKATATFVCDNDKLLDHVEEIVDNSPVKMAEIAPTCEEDGYVTLKATVTSPDGENVSDTKKITLSKTGHNEKYNPEKSGSTPDGTVSWKCYNCKNPNCDDGYIILTVCAKTPDGEPVNKATVKVVGNGIKEEGKSGANGLYTVTKKLPKGDYQIEISYTDEDGENYDAVGDICFGNEFEIEAELGNTVLNTNGNFECCFCKVYRKYKDHPFLGSIVAVLHAIIHIFAEKTNIVC